MRTEIEWKFVLGGTCLYGDEARARVVQDLRWSVTPVTWAQANFESPTGDPYSPLTGLTQKEALELSARLGARLPTSVEWEWMSGGDERRLFPWGNDEWDSRKANLRPSLLGTVTRVGSFPDGATPEGIQDVAGNVWEWTSSLVPHGGAIIRGGSYNSHVTYAQTRFLNAAPRELSSKGI